jgi:glycosyltransferase involved in cell wall biosynthesis
MKKLRIIGYYHLAVPEHCAGSETTVWAAHRAMVKRGHQCQIICDRSKTAPYTYDGIEVVRPPRRGVQSWLEAYVKDSDLLVTHLDLTSQAMSLAMATKIPLVHFVHNDSQMMYWRVDARVPYKNALTIYNSNWLAAKRSHWAGQEMPDEWKAPSIIVHPVVEPERYRCDICQNSPGFMHHQHGTKITLVNPTPTKGANTFKALAKQMPGREFLAVEGGYGDQVITAPGTDPRTAATGNIEWMAHTPDIREVFRKTRVLLMPSDYESYGRVGIEAACAGIPTIAHPTEGLKEAFGDAGIFIDRNDIAAWYVELERLLTDEVYYRERSRAVLALANALDPESQFDRLEAALIETAQRYQNGVPEAMKMWTSDCWIYKMQDGTYRKVDNPGRIPTGAVLQVAGKGTQLPEAMAREHGWIDVDAKAISAPAENKAIASPAENKQRNAKKTQDLAA